MRILPLYTGGGVSMSPEVGAGRRKSEYVRVVADGGMAITDGETVAVCMDTLHPESWADCALPETEELHEFA